VRWFSSRFSERLLSAGLGHRVPAKTFKPA
jgi:hypothetical protein